MTLDTNVLVSGAAILLSTAAGLLGVIVGGWITARRQREERRHNQIKEQLEHFYSPMLGIRTLIRSKTEVRVNITTTAKKLPSVESEDLTKIIEYNKEQLRKELIPLYRKMVDHFTDHLWLAEPTTRAYYRTLIEFVEIWERLLQGTMPGEVAQEIGHSEEKLQPFYENLEETLEQLPQGLNQ